MRKLRLYILLAGLLSLRETAAKDLEKKDSFAVITEEFMIKNPNMTLAELKKKLILDKIPVHSLGIRELQNKMLIKKEADTSMFNFASIVGSSEDVSTPLYCYRCALGKTIGAANKETCEDRYGFWILASTEEVKTQCDN